MSPQDIEAFLADVEGRANKATPGPWQAQTSYSGYGFAVFEVHGEDAFCLGREFEIGVNDADFIANARADIPRLVAIARAQQAYRATCYEALAMPSEMGPIDLACGIRMLRYEADSIGRENVEFRAHITTLEALLVRARELTRSISAPPDCGCETCTLARDIDVAMPSSTLSP